MDENKIKDDKRLAVIVPAFNEAGSIAEVIKDIRGHCPCAEIVVVDDGSADNTSEIARKAGSTILRLPVNIGYGAALQTGFRYAIESDIAYAAIMDGDGQHIAEEIEKILSPVIGGECDLVIGSRYSGEEIYEGSFIRRVGTSLFAWLASFSLGFTVTDPTSGFQAMNRRIMKFFTTSVYPSDYPDADILIASKRNGFRIKEVSVKMLTDSSGESMHSGFKPLYYIFKMLFSIFLTFLRGKTV